MIEAAVHASPAPPRRARSVLLVDDDQAFRERLGQALHARGFEVTTAAAGPGAVEAARRVAPEFAVVETRLPGAETDDILAKLVPAAPKAKIIALARNGSIASAVGAFRRGARDYLTKPIEADAIVDALWRLDVGAPLDALEATPSLARATWEHLQRVLLDSGGNISETARRLGIARRTLQLKLKKDPPRA